MNVQVESFEITLDSTLPEKTVAPLTGLTLDPGSDAFSFFLVEIKNGDTVIAEFDEPKKMVPSFDKGKKASFILQYSDAEKEIPATLSMILEVDITEGVTRAAGYGWTSALINVEVENLPTIADHDQMLSENKLADAQNNVEDAYDASGEDLGK